MFLLYLLASLLLASVSLPPVTWHKGFNLNGQPRIQVSNDNVDIRLYASNRKDVEAILYADTQISSDVRITDHQYGNLLELGVRVPGNWSTRFGGRAPILEIKVPPDSDISVHSEHGSVTARGIDGRLGVRADNGNIEAIQISGPVNTESGHGDLHLDGTFKSASLHTRKGNIAVQISPGSKMSSGWTVQTEDGNIDLQLPDGFSANLDARAGDGNLRIDFLGGSAAAGHQSILREPINGGGPQLEIRSDRGNIMVRRTSGSI